MDLIQRPKKVQKAERGYLTNEKYQDYAENQFKVIYDYLDGASDEVNSKITEESNSNGTVLKFSNGLMICSKIVTLNNIAVSLSSGTIYTSGYIDLGKFPEKFKDSPMCNLSLSSDDYFGYIGYHKRELTDTENVGSIQIFRPVATTTGRFIVNIVAIGKYK